MEDSTVNLIEEDDEPPLIGFNRHVETIHTTFFRFVPSVRLHRECLRTKDDGSVALNWAIGDDTYLSPESPIIIMLVADTSIGCNLEDIQDLRCPRKFNGAKIWG